MKHYRTDELAARLGSTLVGKVAEATTLCAPDAPQAHAVVLCFKANQAAALEQVPLPLAVLIVPENTHTVLPHIPVADVRLALAQLSELFDDRPVVAEGIHPSAYIADTAQLAVEVHIAEKAVVRAASIGAGSRIGPHCFIDDTVQIGKNCILHAHVSLYAGVIVGDDCIIHSGAVIGSDGFGYAASQGGAMKIHHLGRVRLGQAVEIGANTCIDRATLGETLIGDRTKIDNLCQIGHNVSVGTDCLIAGTTAIAGSTRLGNRVMLGGGVGLVDHIHLGDDVRIAARSLVTKSVPSGETWAGNPAEPQRKYVRKLYLQNKLETIWQRIKG